MKRTTISWGPFTINPLWWWDADSRAAEAFSAILAWYWGILLLLPFNTFGSSKSYSSMAEIGSETTWGVIYCLIAFVQSTALCGGVRYFRGPGAALAMLGWAAAAVMFVLSNPFTHAVGIYSLLTIANLWVLTRGPTSNGR